MSKLLLAEHPLVVLPSLAVAFGNVNMAIILQQIHYWISDPRAPEREGRRWHYATYAEWKKQFPWLAEVTIRKLVNKLEEVKIVDSIQPNGGIGEQRKWYSINYEELKKLEIQLTAPLIKKITPPDKKDHPPRSKVSDVYREETKEETKEDSSSRADKKEEQERTMAMAKLAELQRGEQAKLRSRPKPPVEPDLPFHYEPTVLHPIADKDKQLSDDLYDEGVSKGCILALLRAHPNRAHIRQSLNKLKHAIKTKGVKSPDGFMRHVMNDPYEEERIGKTALKEADRLRQSALEAEKAKREWVARESIRRAPQSKQANAQSMSELMKLLPGLSSKRKSRQVDEMTAH